MKERVAEQVSPTDHSFQGDVTLIIFWKLCERIPNELRNQVEEHRKQIADVKKNLVNSDARRHNSLLTASNLHDPLKPLLRTNGEVSELFPGTMAKLFAMSGEYKYYSQVQ